MPVMLEGKEVPFTEIDFDKHKFIRMQRPPVDEILHFRVCHCGMNLRTLQEVRDHHKAGHFDMPSYREIKIEPTIPPYYPVAYLCTG